ncbi:peptidylprolyl isomerase fpr4 [Mortierella hygrophila]|uniref:FK506-binding protein n=1 Tax=Mortierella hygrophila TaxID=979708 RepID=A0A9P6FBJ8_9FUNG|nr:peptidylprolyl isomerase fpr4 [Mortierella hygrophila]
MILGFWGLTILPDKTYTQIVDNPFKVSMAALDEETKPGRTSLRVSVNNKSQVLCSLIPGSVDQQKLDLAFAEGEEITFSVTGDNVVHLSGNYLPDTGAQDGDEDEDDYDEEDDDMYGGYDQDDDGNIVISQGTKRLADLIGDEDEDEDSEDDPDFTGEDDEEDEDDSDDDDDEESSNPYAAQAEGDEDDSEEEDDDEDDEVEIDGDDDEDEDGDDDEDDSEDDEDEEPEPVKKEAAPATKKQKVSEEKAIPIKPKKEVTPAKAKEEPKKAHKKTLPNGLVIEDTKTGEGARAKSGKKIGMRYIGRLENGKVFDKNTSGKPFSFKLGAGEVIKGWDFGIQGMQLNGERRLTIPPALAYGAQGAPPDIPRNATLVFEVKLVSLK